MITESPNALVEKVKAAEPKQMATALDSFYGAQPEEKGVLERRVFELGHTRAVFVLLGISYAKPSREDMLRLEYYAMLLRQEELKATRWGGDYSKRR